MNIILIRHGQTEGNLKKRYIGSTDEPLCTEGMEQIRNNIKENRYPAADLVYTSPLKRCIQTAELIYPDKEPIPVENLRECDFGELENKNYLELWDNAGYQKWLASNGTLEFPSGEKQKDFKKRCRDTFKRIMENSLDQDIALVVHGGTIMAILEKYGVPEKGFYDWQVKNGEGYLCELGKDNISLKVIKKLGETGEKS